MSAAHSTLGDSCAYAGTEPKTDQEADDLGIEDAVIRELARSLQPPRG
ncbi:hypothetical protein [Microvirga sp. KLBC 81]|nr:hypothetical protein [Microvirga sp. KLBC 81]